jgi:hypothetical protein
MERKDEDFEMQLERKRKSVYEISNKCYESKKWKDASEMRKERPDRILETTPDLK